MAAALAVVAEEVFAVGPELEEAAAVVEMMFLAACTAALGVVVEGLDHLRCLQRPMGRKAHAVVQVFVEVAVVCVGPADSLQNLCHSVPCTALT